MDKRLVKVIGITGGIGTGKSTVSKYIISLGYSVVDSDDISHQVILSTGIAYQSILKEFGNGILNDNKEINRKKLGNIVFSNKEKLLKLNSIMHPIIRDETQNQNKKLVSEGHNLIFNDVPLLYENNLELHYDFIALVYCDRSTQIQRVLKRDGLSQQEVETRLSRQIDIEVKKSKANYILDNSNSLDRLYLQVDQLIDQLKSS